MVYDPDDTIAAIGTATGGAARGMVRISGPQTVACLKQCFTCSDVEKNLSRQKNPAVISGSISSKSQQIEVPCDLFLWPNDRSYTRQPIAELHTFGSPPLLEAILNEVCSHNVRVAEPGEFTLRAFLAGRMDLTQAEAVLGVIDANDQQSLDTALTQLAGGLSQPLSKLREQLLYLLAELEAGLDFVEEDIDFISADALMLQLSQAQQTIADTIEQMSQRSDTVDLPRVTLVGPPNVGKSSLFNALIATNANQQQAIVSSQSGTTRDYVTAMISLDGLNCELIDTAGQESIIGESSIEQAAQNMTTQQHRQANLRLYCTDNIEQAVFNQETSHLPKDSYLIVHTKTDLRADTENQKKGIACSSVTGVGIENLKATIRERLSSTMQNDGGVVASTSARCLESLQQANQSLQHAHQLTEQSAGEELVAAEIRESLTQLGRVVGTVYTDDILDRIFSQFCIGK